MGVTEFRISYSLREGSFTGDPGRYVKAPVTAICLHRGLCTSERTWYQWGEGAVIPGTVNNEIRRALGSGNLPLR
jgi:hypothetical protein